MAGLYLGGTLKHLWPSAVKGNRVLLLRCLSNSGQCNSFSELKLHICRPLPAHRNRATARPSAGPVPCIQFVRTIKPNSVPPFHHRPKKESAFKKGYIIFLMTMLGVACLINM